MFLTAALAMPFAATAAPLVLEETARIASPDPAYGWPIEVAIDGDWMIATGNRIDLNAQAIDYSTWLYQRQSNGTWTLVRKLHQLFFTERDDDPPTPPIQLALQGGVAVILMRDVSAIFERTATGWVNVPSPIVTDGVDVEINGGTIVVTSGHCDWATNAYRKGANGAWALVRSTPPEPDPAPCGFRGLDGDIDVAANGTTTIVSTRGTPVTARIFEGPFGTAPVMTRLTPSDPIVGVGYAVAIENTSALATSLDINLAGTQAYTRSATGTWVHSGPLLRPDQLDVGAPVDLELSGTLALLPRSSDWLHGRATGSVGVFERNADGTYRYAARLVASDRGADRAFGEQAKISGRRVVARHHAGSSAEGAYIYELPSTLTQPPTVQDNFEDGNASDWTIGAGSTFAVATTATSRVYRQSNTTGNAASIWNNTNRKNQSIEADIKPTAFSSTTGDKWFGLVTRYSDANNYYYVTLRNNNTVLLRRMVNGVFTTLASASLPITLNRSYRVRLETIGTRLRVFVDNRLLAEASDRSLAQGRAGVMMFRTRADYDNILVSSNPQTRLVIYAFAGVQSQWLWETVGTWGDGADAAYAQFDVTGGARGITGIATDDQIVHARIRKTNSSGTNNWFGLATRYRDEGNYYYVTLRNDNTVSLRKLVNGAIVELDSAPLTIAANTWYRVRFEAVGNYLRVYINDVPRLDAVDTSHATGRYGPVMYRTAAEYSDILAVEP